MSPAKAQQLVITSAAVVAGVYAYRRYGGQTQASLGTFVTAWGTIFFILALGVEVAPGPAGAMALLVMTADLLANTTGLAGQVQAGLSSAGVPTTTSPAPKKNATAVHTGHTVPHSKVIPA